MSAALPDRKIKQGLSFAEALFTDSNLKLEKQQRQLPGPSGPDS